MGRNFSQNNIAGILPVGVEMGILRHEIKKNKSREENVLTLRSKNGETVQITDDGYLSINDKYIICNQRQDFLRSMGLREENISEKPCGKWCNDFEVESEKILTCGGTIYLQTEKKEDRLCLERRKGEN